MKKLFYVVMAFVIMGFMWLAVIVPAHARSGQLCPKCDRLLSFADHPTYWTQNPTARLTVQQACIERGPGTAPLMRYCGVAGRAGQAVRSK
jgi:hypothetical protein